MRYNHEKGASGGWVNPISKEGIAVRGLLLSLLGGFLLLGLAPLGLADGGAPDTTTEAPSDSSSSSTNEGVSNPVLFLDVPADHWAVEDLRYLVERGIVTGLPNGTFHGDQAMTRYSAVAMVARAVRFLLNNPELITQKDLAALQDLLFQVTDQLEDVNNRVQTLEAGGTPEGVEQLAALNQRVQRNESALSALKSQVQGLRSASGSVDAEELRKLQRQANANFIVAIAGLFVGIIGIALATMS